MLAINIQDYILVWFISLNPTSTLGSTTIMPLTLKMCPCTQKVTMSVISWSIEYFL